MLTTSNLRRLTRLTRLTLAVALACGVYATAQARQTDARRTESAAVLLATLRDTSSDMTPAKARARDKAVEELKQLGRAAVPALTEFLNREKGAARVYAASALASIEPTNALARRTLDEVARAGNGDEVIEAAVALAEIDPEDDAAVPALVKMASKTIILPSAKNMRRMRGAAYALALTAPGVRALTPLLGHWDSWVRQAAVFAFDDRTETLAQATPAVRAAVEEAIPALIKDLADKDEIVRGMAAEDLEQIGPDAVPELKRAAAGGDKKLAPAAAELLKRMGRG
jgi:HEAT repeat protein